MLAVAQKPSAPKIQASTCDVFRILAPRKLAFKSFGETLCFFITLWSTLPRKTTSSGGELSTFAALCPKLQLAYELCIMFKLISG